MARNKRTYPDPQPRQHASGQLIVTLRDATTGARRDFYCGVYGRAQSTARYAEIVQAWKDRGGTLDAVAAPPRPAVEPKQGLVGAIAAAYVRDIEQRGIMHQKHLSGVKKALGVLRQVHGYTRVEDFGPLAFQEVRRAMVDKRVGKKSDRRWCRQTINERARHVLNMAEWAVSQEKAPSYWAHALSCVKPLRRGEFGVPDGRKVKLVAPELVEAIRPHVSSVVWAMVQTQRHTGARAGEVCVMRAVDIDTTGPAWLYRPSEHKNQHRGHDRVIALGLAVQRAIRPLLAGRAVTDYLFDPRESFRERAAANATEGKPRRKGQKPSRTQTNRTLNDHYTTATYYRAIQRGCELAGVPAWSTHQLRHLFATETRREFGPEHTQAVLGDRSIRMVDRYAEVSVERAVEVALKIG